jgi:hypothetical protein
MPKKTAPARGKPKAGTAKVDNAQTQRDTNEMQSLRGVSGRAVSIAAVLHVRDIAGLASERGRADLKQTEGVNIR